MTDEQDLDQLASAYLDGTTSAPEAARIAADPDLRARVEELRAVRAALRVHPPVDATRREAAISAALAAFADESADATTADRREGARPAQVTALAAATRKGPSPRALRLLGAAAAVALLAALVPLVSRLNTTDDSDSASEAVDTSLAESADADAGSADSSVRNGPQAGSVTDEAAAEGPVVPVDLGPFDDLAALLVSIETSGLAGNGDGVGEYTRGAGDDGSCLDAGADEARADGATTFEAATATIDGDAVVVLVATDDRGTRTLRVLLSDGCALLVERPL